MYIPRAIIFDLDGTLIDTREDIAGSCNYALATHGYRPLSVEIISRYVGDGSRRLCARAAGLTERDPQLDALVETFVKHYEEHPLVRTAWLPYAQQVLDAVRPLPVALCTNKPRTVTEKVLEGLGVRSRFTVVVGGGDTLKHKPSKEPILLIAEKLHLDPHELVMVGDGPQDVLAGKSCGCRTISIAGGYNSKALLREFDPDILLDSIKEVPQIIARWCEATVRAKSLPQTAEPASR
jgi:phosphoglycolate phosphatase